MAFNLPPPWDPGFALPSNVKDEGLQRRGFVTRQAPRGTYDDPPVGTGGYAVPKYVLSEGYGQGVKVTRWAQRGRYDIPVPNYLDARPRVVADKSTVSGANVITMNALSGTELPASYVRFGQNAATAVLKQVQKAPPDERQRTLKAILDRVDPALYGRTMAISRSLASKMSATAAVHTALARSMSEGAARELLEVGRTGKAPAARSVLGLGCYGIRGSVALSGASALGAVTNFAAEAKAALLDGRTATQIATTAAVQPAAPSVGNCTPDGLNIWTGTSWRRKLAGDTCTGTWNPQVVSSGGAGVTTTNSATGTVVSTKTTAPPADIGMTFIKIGPWTMQDKAGATLSMSKSMLTPEMNQKLLEGVAKASATALALAPNQTLVDMSQYGWSIGIGSTGKLPSAGAKGTKPFARFTHPVTRKLCVMYADLTTGTRDNPKVTFRWAEYQGLLETLVNAVIELVATIVAPVIEALEVVGDLACALANAPNATQTGAAIGVAAGAGASIGAAGAAIVQGQCAKPPPATTEQTTQSDTDGMILPLAIAGAGIAAILLLRKKG